MAVAHVEGQMSRNMEVTERKRRGQQKMEGSKIGSGKLRRQEKLIATKTFILKISKHVRSKLKQILVKYIANLR